MSVKLLVRIGQSVESFGDSGWAAQVAQVEYGADFPEKVKVMIGPESKPLPAGEYTVDLGRAVQRRSVIVEGKRPGSRVSREMLVIDIRAEDLQSVKAAPLSKVS